MPAPPTPKAHRLYVGQYAAKLGRGTYKTAYLPEYLPEYINDIGFNLAKLQKFGGSENYLIMRSYLFELKAAILKNS